MKPGESLLVTMAVIALCVVPADYLYTSRFVPRFKKMEKERIVTSNQLATAKIVSENLNHVRDLVYRNMDFVGQKDSINYESALFDFLTSSIGDLKMRLVSVKPFPPTSEGRVTTYGYDIELDGDFFSFGELCSKLENSRRVMAITSFNVGESSRASGETGPKGLKAGATAQPSGRRSVNIKIHLDTYRVRKG
jgi:hypothetical protein